MPRTSQSADNILAAVAPFQLRPLGDACWVFMLHGVLLAPKTGASAYLRVGLFGVDA
jgi:hypothetical protein